eukprot:FR737415.1.p2 GENE.FR737415.1~~FR737415.1.p2  ORF type:complete len:103 (+),score=11.82 FR737415.1:133-441(+)
MPGGVASADTNSRIVKNTDLPLFLSPAPILAKHTFGLSLSSPCCLHAAGNRHLKLKYSSVQHDLTCAWYQHDVHMEPALQQHLDPGALYPEVKNNGSKTRQS